MDGIINVYKEKGYTSHDVVAIIKRFFSKADRVKIGHAGTLDPDAEGVLIVLLGKCTKLSDYFMDSGKEYRAGVKFGVVTDTYDGTGEIVEAREPKFTETALRTALDDFTGDVLQLPPMYSAIKKDGKKLYDLARKGIQIEREPRKVSIYDIFLESFNGHDEAVIYIKCGKGTYVRSICHDLGQALGCGAHMSSLVRTKSGGFDEDSAVKLDLLKETVASSDFDGLRNVLVSPEKALAYMNKIVVSKNADSLLRNGSKIDSHLVKNAQKIDSLNVLYDEDGNLAGVYEPVLNYGKLLYLKPKTMLLIGKENV